MGLQHVTISLLIEKKIKGATEKSLVYFRRQGALFLCSEPEVHNVQHNFKWGLKQQQYRTEHTAEQVLHPFFTDII